jgi:hypothetical protein
MGLVTVPRLWEKRKTEKDSFFIYLSLRSFRVSIWLLITFESFFPLRYLYVGCILR